MKILVIEDDDVIVDIIKLTFQVGWPSAEIISAKLGEQGINMVEMESPDIVILDLGLPDINGFEVLKSIRLFSKIPVVVLTVQSDELSVVKAIELGAEDYIIKPFRQLEFLARIKGALRNVSQTSIGISSVGPFHFDNSGRRLEYKNRHINLTTTESLILRYLLQNRGIIVSYEKLAQEIWDSTYPDFKKTLRVYISNLQRKIKVTSNERVITCHPGIGYSISKDL